ncbi:hypothetical protein [Nocardiopsis synnemataformans]|uniref:hypothetical protein n=1 Tax=Nocardiopsis synnemataformans TaxID=61305 RepID=UPI003EB6C1D7
MAASTIPQSDDVALAEIRDLSYRIGGGLPGRNQLMKEFGWGAARSSRLLGLYKEQSGPADADYPGPPDHPEDSAHQSGAEWTEADQSPSPTSSPGPGPQSSPVQSSGPARQPQSEERSGPAGGGQSAPVRSEGGPGEDATAPEQSAAAPVRQSAQASPQTSPDPVRPASPPVRTAATVPEDPAQPSPALPQSDGGPVSQSGPAVEPAPVRQSTVDRDTDQSDGPAVREEANQSGGRSAGPDRPPYGLIVATLAISLSAFTAVWGGWVGLGRMVGFGPVNLLPGIGDGLIVDLAITLPIGIEAYAAAALWVAVGGLVHGKGRWFAGVSAATALGLGAFGQAVYHLLEAQGKHTAPDWVVVFVSVLPVVVLGAAGVLLHLVMEGRKHR